MHRIPTEDPSEEFLYCCWMAGKSLQDNSRRVSNDFAWLKVDLTPPFLEHLSFRVGNQLYFVRVEDLDGHVVGPGTIRGLVAIAVGCQGHPCILQMKQTGDDWAPVHPGWGLTHAITGEIVDPPSLATDELVEMTDWELHDFAVQIVREHLEEQGREIMSWTGNPNVDPSVWFVGEAGPEWVVVRVARYPEAEPPVPENWAEIAEVCGPLSSRGNFAPVMVGGADQVFDDPRAPIVPPWRGEPLEYEFEGLVRIG